MDEIAAQMKADPVEYRLRHLSDPRAQHVLNVAAERAKWDKRPSPNATHDRVAKGRGIAFAW